MKVAAILVLIAVALAIIGVVVKGLIWLLLIAAVLVAASVFVSRRGDGRVRTGRSVR